MLYRLASVLFLLSVLTAAHAQFPDATGDWSRVGAAARAGEIPVLVIVTGQDCGHCERMRREFLADPRTSALLEAHSVAREFPRDTGGKVTDFDGERVRSRVFLSRYDIFATPTLLFLDAQGEPLADPLVGYNDAETYHHMVSERLEEARLRMARRDVEQAPALATAPSPVSR